MNYEKIMLELMGRIQILEEKVAALEAIVTEETTGMKKVGTEEIRGYISDRKAAARAEGKCSLVLRSGDIHKELGLKNAMPQVCNAMYQSMGEGDTILHTTPKGRSSTIEIEYRL